MNGHKESPVNPPPDERLLEWLSGLRSCAPRADIDPGTEEKLLRDLRQRCRRKSVLARFFPKRAGDYWPVVLIFILLFLLGLDLFFIIRLLLR